jgi:hypothetical protein
MFLDWCRPSSPPSAVATSTAAVEL